MSDHVQSFGSPPPGRDHWKTLQPALDRCGLSVDGLYLRYVALGGSTTSAGLAAHVRHGDGLTLEQHDLAVLALNERFLELGDPERLPYAGGS